MKPGLARRYGDYGNYFWPVRRLEHLPKEARPRVICPLPHATALAIARRARVIWSGRKSGDRHSDKSGRQRRADNGIRLEPAIEFTPVLCGPVPDDVALVQGRPSIR